MREVGRYCRVGSIALIIVSLSGHVTCAAAGQDSPRGRSEQEVLSGWNGDTRVGLAVEYERDRFDLKSPSYDLPFRLEAADVDAAYARASIHIADRFDLWGRLGVADIRAGDYKGNTSVVYGFGLRVQAWSQGPWSWDVAGQMTSWSISRDNSVLDVPLFDGNSVTVTTKGTLDDLEWLFKTGPAWRSGPWTLRGGLAARYATGNLAFPVTVPGAARSFGFNVNGSWDAGVYAGATWQFAQPRTKALGRWSPDCYLNVEGGVTGGCSFITVGLVFMPWNVRQ